MEQGTAHGCCWGPWSGFTTTTFFGKERLGSRSIVHFIPFVILTVLVPLFNSDLLTWRSIDYGMLTVFDSWNKEPITPFQYTYGSLFIVQFLHAMVYMVMSYRFVGATKKGLEEQYSNFDNISIKWQRTFQATTILVLLLVTSFVLYQFYTGDYRRKADYFYVMPMSIVVYILLYHAIKYPNLIFKNVLSEKEL